MLDKLEEWAFSEGPLPRFIELYRELLRVQTGTQSRIVVPQPNVAESIVADQMRQGSSLLTFNRLSLDWSLLKEMFQAVTRTLTDHGVHKPGEADMLMNLAGRKSSLQRIVRAWYQGSSLSAIATGHGIEEGSLAAVVKAALQPFLIAHNEMWSGLVVQPLWRRSHCPVCGGKPDFAFLEKEEGARWLLCSRCNGRWLFQRLECPYCGTHNQEALAYLTDDEGLYRLYTCDECHSYIKCIDLRRAESEVLLLLERLITVELDRQAVEAGYKSALTEADLFGQIYEDECQENSQ